MPDSDPASFYDFRQYRLARGRDGTPGEVPLSEHYDGLRRFIAIDGRAFQLVTIDLQPSREVDSATERRVGLFARRRGGESLSRAIVPLHDWGRDEDDFYVIKAARDAEPIGSYLQRVGPLPEVASARLIANWLDALAVDDALMELIGAFRPDRLLMHEGSLLYEDFSQMPSDSTSGDPFLASVEWLIESLVTGKVTSGGDRVPQSASIESLRSALRKIITHAAGVESGRAELGTLPTHERPIRQWLVSGTPLIEQNFLAYLPWEIRGTKARAIKAKGTAFALAPSDDILPHALTPRQHGEGVLRRDPLPDPAVPHGSTSRCGNGRLVGEEFPEGDWTSLNELVAKDAPRSAIQKVAAVIAAWEKLELAHFPVWWIPTAHAFFDPSGGRVLIRTYFSMTSLMEGLPLPDAMLDRLHRADRDSSTDGAHDYRRSAVTMGLLNQVPAFAPERSDALPPDLAELLEKARVSPDSFPAMEAGELLEIVQDALDIPRGKRIRPEPPAPAEGEPAIKAPSAKPARRALPKWLPTTLIGAAVVTLLALVAKFADRPDVPHPADAVSAEIASQPTPPSTPLINDTSSPDPEPAVAVNASEESVLITEEVPLNSAPVDAPAPRLEDPEIPLPPETIEGRAAFLAASAVSPGKAALEEGRLIGAIDEFLSSIAALPEVEIRLRDELEATLVKWRDSNIAIDSPEKLAKITAAARYSGTASALLADLATSAGDPTTARQWLARSAENGNVSLMADYGQLIASGQIEGRRGVEAAAEWFQKGAEGGDPTAQFLYGECLLLGKGAEVDQQAAADWLSQSATAGNARAMDLLGVCYVRGWGVEASAERATELFQQAVDAGNPGAHYNLGVKFLSGVGVDKSAERAVELFQKGAYLGEPNCMLALARALSGGVGVSENATEAQAWYQKAAELGNADAIAWCEENGIDL